MGCYAQAMIGLSARLGLIPAAKAGGSQHLKFEECVRV